jgi:hypothetical protein
LATSPEAEQSTPKAGNRKADPKPQYRFGIGEWYGKSFAHLSGDERRRLATIQLAPKEQRPQLSCPFLSRPNKPVACHKEGGICSLRSYERPDPSGPVSLDRRGSPLVTTCPSRFEQDDVVYKWVNDTILPNRDAVPIGETPFLRRMPRAKDLGAKTARKVGRIDNVLVVRDSEPLDWCPVEKQAVYFSGRKMLLEFEAIAASKGDEVPFPLVSRRPDYRSSSAKRLLPQLETKVPLLRKWAKKMAVVVDDSFFSEFAEIRNEEHITLAEILWFVVSYELKTTHFVLKPQSVHLTTLENSLAGVLAATPIPQPEFEATVRAKLKTKIASGITAVTGEKT